MSSSHWRTILFMFVYATLVGSLAFCRMHFSGTLGGLNLSQKCGIGYLVFLFAFWLTYFLGQQLKLGTLRVFLDEHTYRKEHNDPAVAGVETAKAGVQVNQVNSDPMNAANAVDTDEKMQARNDALQAKALAGIVSQGIFMTVVALFLGPVLNRTQPLNEYETLLRPVIAGLGMMTITLLLWSIDLLDTAQNVFKGSNAKSLSYRVYFFRQVGVCEPKGGASYRFYGFASLSMFLISAISFYEPLLTGLGVTAFCYLGYPVLFGYKVIYDKNTIKEVTFDSGTRWPAISLGLAGFLINILIWVLSLP